MAKGAPIVPIGEKLLWSGYDFFLNLGGIANLSYKNGDLFTGFDICPANRVMNMLAHDAGKEFDASGAMAMEGKVNESLLRSLHDQAYYDQPYPKSLANEFGTSTLYPIIKKSGVTIPDALRTFTEHIVQQVNKSIRLLWSPSSQNPSKLLLVTGGGALNTFLMKCLRDSLQAIGVELTIPDEKMINYKEAIVMAFIGVLRWREENNVLASVTGASRSSIGGAVWIGQEA